MLKNLWNANDSSKRTEQMKTELLLVNLGFRSWRFVGRNFVSFLFFPADTNVPWCARTIVKNCQISSGVFPDCALHETFVLAFFMKLDGMCDIRRTGEFVWTS